MKTNYIFFFCSILILGLSACSSREKVQSSTEIAEQIVNNEAPVYTFKDVETLYTEDTKKIMIIKAARQLRYENGNERFPDGVFMDRFDEQEKLMTTLKADSGFYDYKENVYKVMGNVVVVNLKEKQTLETEELNWNKESEEIYTEVDVKITDEYQIITGTGLTANQDFSEYTITDIKGSTSR